MSRAIRIYALFGDHGLHAGKEVVGEGYSVLFAAFCFDDYVDRDTRGPFAVRKERFQSVLSEIERGRYDMVYADSREALLIHFALRKRGRASPEFLIQDPDLLLAAQEVREFLSLHYGEDPLPAFLTSEANHWMIISRSRLPHYRRVGIPPSRVYYLPMAASSIGFFFPGIERFLRGGASTSQGDFVLSAGTHDRDYGTLVRAVEGMSVRVRVICNLQQHPPIPAGNVEWTDSLPEDRYLDAFRQSRYVVVPLRPSARAAGQMNCVIPMHLGKVVVVSRSEHLEQHITHGETGFFFEAGDATSLRRTIEKIESDPAGTASVADAAARHAQDLSEVARAELERLLDNAGRGATRGP